MPAIDYVALEFDADDPVGASTLTLQTGSSTMTAERHWLILGMVFGRSNQNNQTFQMRFDVGGTPYARFSHRFPYGAGIGPQPTVAMSGRPMIFATTYITATGSSDVMQIYAADEASDGYFGGGRIYALNMTNIVSGNGRWHSESPNADLSGTSPTSGWTTLGSAGAGSLTFTAPRTGRYLIVASCETTASAAAVSTDEVAIRLVQDGNEVSGTVTFGDLETTPTTGISNYCVARTFGLTASTSYTFELQANGTNANSNIFYRRIRVHALDSAAIEDNDVVYSTVTGALVAANQDLTLGMTLPLNPSGSSRDYLMFSDYTHETDYYDEGHFLISGAVEAPTYGFSDLQLDFGLTATDDLTHVYGHNILRSLSTASYLQLRLSKYNSGGNNQFGTDCARALGGPVSLIALRLFSQTVTTGSNIVESMAAVTGSGMFQGTYTIDSGLVRILSTVEDMQNQLNQVQDTIASVLQSVQITSTTVVSGNRDYIFTGLTEADEFYAGMGVIVTSGTTGIARLITGYNQVSGTIYFNERLPFSPVTGASVVVIEDYTPIGGSVG